MIEVLISLGGQGSRRRMVVRARSIIDALCVAEEHDLNGEVSVVFPIDADSFFADEKVKISSVDGGNKL